MKLIELAAALLFLLICSVRQADASSHGFMLFHQISSHGGMCLQVKEAGRSYEPHLSRKCLSSNAAWRWLWLPGGMLMNSFKRECLGVLKLQNFERLSLLPCVKSELSSWSCGVNYTLELGRFRLEHQLVYDQWEIIGAHPILKSKSATSGQSKCMVYSESEVEEPIPVCDMPQSDLVHESKIVTTDGGKHIRVPCVFPYIYKGEEKWECIVVPEINVNPICGVSSSLDQNGDSWGICPEHNRGTMTEWGEPLCDRACGGGNVVLSRRCLFQPCNGETKKVTLDDCNTSPCSGDRVLAFDGSSLSFPVDYVFPVVGHAVFSKCFFPFIHKGIKVHECISSLKRPRKWCSLTENYDKHQKWAYCSAFYVGSWSSWSKEGEEGWTCSKDCGGGISTVRRKCRFHPCSGWHSKVEGRCNTHACAECVETQDYYGTMSIAADGSVCEPWTRISGQENPGANPTLQENYCRRALQERFQPYCYTSNAREHGRVSSLSWMYCDLPPCGTNFSQPGILYTVPAYPYDDREKYPTTGGSCVFPFQVLDHERYDRCVSSNPAGREWCRTRNTTIDKDFAYCPSRFRGKWSQWKISSECTKRCGRGYLLSYRICLLPPCKGKSLRQEDIECNTAPCTWSIPASDSCFSGVGMSYSGSQKTTISGYECQYWSANSPVEHNLYPHIIPSDMPELRENFCRNPTPGIRYAPWCYSGRKIGFDRVKWEYCDVVKCPEGLGIIYGIPLHILKITSITAAPSPCNFPFMAPDQETKYESCQKARVRGIGTVGYCEVRNDTITFATNILEGLKSGQYAICPSNAQGTSGAWTKSYCSKTCGGGFWVLKRKCLYPPCKGDSKILRTERCSTHACMDCFVGNGDDYHGTYRTTYLGETCAYWRDSPDFEEGMNVTENYCRNPGAGKPIPWCYSQKTMRDTYCDPKHCVLGEISYTIPQRGYSDSGAKCAFPYNTGFGSYWNCRNVFDGYYCPVVRDDVSDPPRERLGLCPPSYKGAWSSWHNTGFCSKHCGGGLLVHIRTCLYAPCEGYSIKYEEECNTRQCKWKNTMTENVDCYMNRGYDYRGKETRTFSGLTCMQWNAKIPHSHEYEYDFLGRTLSHNYCRNPSFGNRYAPWCFTTTTATRWEYCDIPQCSSLEGEIIAFPPSKVERKCHFPYVLDGKERTECTRYVPDKTTTKYICGVSTGNVTTFDSSSWGYCTRAYRGTWSPWSVVRSNPCTVKCGGGRVRYRRVCRYYPCRGEVETQMNECNTQPCNECYNFEAAGIDYTGDKSTTWDGIPCMKRLFKMEFTAKCRNSDPEMFNSPWCIPKNLEFSKVACGIKHCPTSKSKGSVTALDFSNNGAGFCKFPFNYEGRRRHSCIKRKNFKGYWCSFGSSMEGDQIMAPCFKAYKGTWSKWSEPSCSRPCGRGKNIYTRHCRYPPCEGSATRRSGWCNTGICDPSTNCYNATDRGITYVGPENETVVGTACSEWSEKEKDRYPDLDLDHGNCRNPGGISPRPWCHSGDTYALCGVPPCPDPRPYQKIGSIVVNAYGQKGIELPCVFPFRYSGKTYRSCTDSPLPRGYMLNFGEPIKTGTKWCATVPLLYDMYEPEATKGSAGAAVIGEYGYCKDSQVGTWVPWAQADRSCTKDCYQIAKRRCLYDPCEGHPTRITSEPCYTGCKVPLWKPWNQWSSCQRCYTISLRTRILGDNYIWARSKLCEELLVTETDSETSCTMPIAKKAATEKAVMDLLREYFLRISFSSSAARSEVFPMALLVTTVMSLLTL